MKINGKEVSIFLEVEGGDGVDGDCKPNDLAVNVTTDGSAYSADKTYAEIAEAAAAGRTVYADFNPGGGVCRLYMTTPPDGEKVAFMYSQIVGRAATHIYVYIYADGRVLGGVDISDTQGGINPVAKTEAMTQEVGVDADGKLYTEPTAESGGAEENALFSGKTASFYGDSLTEANYHYTKGYHKWIEELLGLASYSNYGVSGYKISDVLNKVNSVTDAADVIFIMCGVNDENFSTPLGEFGDSTTGTIYGGYDALCSALKTKYPTKLVVFITPHYQTKYPHNAGVTSYEVAKAMKAVCEKYAIPVYDNFVLSGIYSTNLSYWTTDNCHWNDKAHEMVGKNLAKFMVDTFRYLYVSSDEGDGGEETPVTHSVTNNLTNVTNSNAVASVEENTAYNATLTATDGYELNTVTVTMGGVDITATAYSGGVVNISAVTGAVIITASATVTETPVTLTSIDAVFNQGSNTIYDTASLDVLKQYLTVTATYSDESTAAVTDYTLSGTLTVGNSTITASYGGKTDTFDVIVSAVPIGTPVIINNTLSSATYDGNTLTLDGLQQTFCGVVLAGATEINIDVDPNLENKIGWLAAKDGDVYRAIGESSRCIETYDFNSTLTEATNRTKLNTQWPTTGTITLKVEGSYVNLYFNGELAHSVTGDALCYLCSSQKTNVLYGITIT